MRPDEGGAPRCTSVIEDVQRKQACEKDVQIVFCSWGTGGRTWTTMQTTTPATVSGRNGTRARTRTKSGVDQASTRRLCEAPRHIEAAAQACVHLPHVQSHLHTTADGRRDEGFWHRRSKADTRPTVESTGANSCLFLACLRLFDRQDSPTGTMQTLVNESRKGKRARRSAGAFPSFVNVGEGLMLARSSCWRRIHVGERFMSA